MITHDLYPLSLIWQNKDILVISTPQDLPTFERLLEMEVIELNYQKEQPSPDGLVLVFIIGEV